MNTYFKLKPSLNLVFSVFIVLLFHMALNTYAQQNKETSISFEKKIKITLENPLSVHRNNEPISIPIQLIIEKYPDFNKDFFRIKNKSFKFEPLDIPTQIKMIPGSGFGEIVFQVDLEPKEEKTIELWYNPEGTGLPEYPARTQSIEEYGPNGSNIVWENEHIAYRFYSGIVDFFGKAYPHLRMHGLEFGSYHHEKLWGIDPFIVGKTPGLGGVILFKDKAIFQCYGGESLKYTKKAIKGGPVCSGAVIKIEDKSTSFIESVYTVFPGRYENNVVTTILDRESGEEILIAPGILKFKDETVFFEDKKGFIAAWGIPVTEYGTIGIALIWDPHDFDGLFESENERFIKLIPSPDGKVKYLSLAVWNRGSAEQPDSFKPFIDMVERLALGFRNPVLVQID